MFSESIKMVGKAKSKPVSRSKRAGLQFPVGRVHRRLKKGNYSQRYDENKLITVHYLFNKGSDQGRQSI